MGGGVDADRRRTVSIRVGVGRVFSSGMSNSLRIPLVALGGALVLVIAALAGGSASPALSELQIGLVAWAFTLGVFAVQGAVSIGLEGRRLQPGVRPPRLTRRRSAAMLALSGLLLGLAGLVGLAIISGQSTPIVGTIAGAGCFVLALLLLLSKEAFIGHEAHLESRTDSAAESTDG